MKKQDLCRWIRSGGRLESALTAFHQPLTCKHLEIRTDLNLDACSFVVGQLRNASLVRCLNPAARRGRVYWLTDTGIRIQRNVRRQLGRSLSEHDFPVVDWGLYGWVCFSHRSTIIRTLVRPLQPSVVKRRARSMDSSLRMSANNVRDIIRLFLERDVVMPFRDSRRVHPCYELTDVGKKLQHLLVNVGVDR